MNLLTLADAKADAGINAVAGNCSSGSKFLSYLNAANRKIARRGDWDCLQKRAKFCTQDSCVVFPSFVGHIRAINVCKDVTTIMNGWYEFMPYGNGSTKPGCVGDDAIRFKGMVPVFKNVTCGSTAYIRVYPRLQEDIGKVVTFYGIDENGQEMMTLGDDGLYYVGNRVTIAAPYGSTSKPFSVVTRVSKPATAGQLYVYQYDATNDVLIDMAVYNQNDTEPSYRKYEIPQMSNCGSCTSKSVEVWFKMDVVPLVNDTDILPIQNLDAIKMMIMSLRKEEASDFEGARKDELACIKEMNLQEAEANPDDQIPVTVNPFGTAKLSNRRIGHCI